MKYIILTTKRTTTTCDISFYVNIAESTTAGTRFEWKLDRCWLGIVIFIWLHEQRNRKIIREFSISDLWSSSGEMKNEKSYNKRRDKDGEEEKGRAEWNDHSVRSPGRRVKYGESIRVSLLPVAYPLWRSERLLLSLLLLRGLVGQCGERLTFGWRGWPLCPWPSLAARSCIDERFFGGIVRRRRRRSDYDWVENWVKVRREAMAARVNVDRGG